MVLFDLYSLVGTVHLAISKPTSANNQAIYQTLGENSDFYPPSYDMVYFLL